MRGAALLLAWGLGCTPAASQVEGAEDAPAPDVGADDPDTAAPEVVPCGLYASEAHWPVIEGDRVSLTVGCSLADLDAVSIEALGLPDGADFDPATGALSWQTDGADAGPVDLTFTAPAPDGLPETVVVSVYVHDSGEASGPRPPDPETYRTEFGLPVVHIDPVGGLSESYTSASITLDGETVSGSAKIRGASSTYYPKKSFTLDFEGEELGVDDWGDRTRGHLYLLSTFDDNSYVRQKLVFDTWQAMAEAQGAERLTPRTFFAVVYLEGEYLGLYLGVDRMDDEYIRHMGFTGEGDLYKSVNHDANFRLEDSRGATKGDLATGWEKKEGADETEFDPLRALMSFVGGADAATFAAEGDAWLDLDELMDWEMLVTWTQSEDSAGKNAYLYLDEETGRFRFSPWDFNASYGQNWYTLRYPASYVHDFSYRNRTFELIDAEPSLRARQAARYATLTAPGGPLTAAWQLETVEAYIDRIDLSARRDWAMWGDAYRDFERWESPRDAAGDWTDIDGERAYLEAWLLDRDAEMADWLAD